MTSSIDGNGDINKQQQPTKRATRPQSIAMPSSTKPPRMVDRELQRIKSLAMVSGLNRSFTQEPQTISIVNRGPSPTPSVSSSTSHHHHRPATISSFSDMRLGTSVRSHRSNSVNSHHSKGGGLVPPSRSHRRLKQAELDEIERDLIAMFEDAYRTQHQDRVEHWVSTVVLPPPSDSFSVLSTTPEDPRQQQPSNPALEVTMDDADQNPTTTTTTRPRRDSVISSDVYSTKDQRIKELETQYGSAIKRLEHSEKQHAVWAEHIQRVLSTQLAEKEAEASKARQLAELVVYQERMMAEMQRDLDRRDDIQVLNCIREELRQLRDEIAILTNTKSGIQHDMDRFQNEQDTSRRAVERTQSLLREVSAQVETQRAQIDEKISAMKRQLEEKEEELVQRMSVIDSNPNISSSSNSSISRVPHTARYTGGPLPPPAPPPTDPLPPVPATPTHATTTKAPSIRSSSTINDNASSVFFDDQHSEMAYREFTEQLQTRLSVSKEIDDLQLWQSEDFEEFERRMHEKYKDIDADKRQSFIQTLRSKEGATFWRGMKKKLRV